MKELGHQTGRPARNDFFFRGIKFSGLTFYKCSLALLLLSACCSLVAENLLKNSNFSDKSPDGLPLYWEFRGDNINGFVTNDNYLKLCGGKIGKEIYLLQNSLPLKGATKYILSYKVKGTLNSKFRLYCEWTRKSNDKLVWNNSGSEFYTAGEQWETHKMPFTYEIDSAPAYLAVNVKDAGEVELKDLSIEVEKEDSPDNSKLLVNGNFEIRTNNIPLGWEFRGGKESVVYKDGEVLLKGANGQDLWLIQHKLPLQPGVSYNVSYEAKGQPSTGEYRVYFEAIQVINGKDDWKPFAADFKHPSAQWEKKSFVFTYPDKVKACYLVIHVKSGADMEFRNIYVNLVK